MWTMKIKGMGNLGGVERIELLTVCSHDLGGEGGGNRENQIQLSNRRTGRKE